MVWFSFMQLLHLGCVRGVVNVRGVVCAVRGAVKGVVSKDITEGVVSTNMPV
jgi:hypothetical protein